MVRSRPAERRIGSERMLTGTWTPRKPRGDGVGVDEQVYGARHDRSWDGGETGEEVSVYMMHPARYGRYGPLATRS